MNSEQKLADAALALKLAMHYQEYARIDGAIKLIYEAAKEDAVAEIKATYGDTFENQQQKIRDYIFKKVQSQHEQAMKAFDECCEEYMSGLKGQGLSEYREVCYRSEVTGKPIAYVYLNEDGELTLMSQGHTLASINDLKAQPEWVEAAIDMDWLVKVQGGYVRRSCEHDGSVVWYGFDSPGGLRERFIPE
jgi:hypothetical protein